MELITSWFRCHEGEHLMARHVIFACLNVFIYNLPESSTVPELAMNRDILIQCCITQDWDSLESNAHQVSQAINKREYEINQVICDLKSLLTDTKEESRANGMKIVSFILTSLNSDILSQTEVSCILEFFINRMKDRVSVIENSMTGLGALCQFSHFNFEMATSLFYTIQNDVSIQMLSPEFKLELYRVIRVMFDRYKPEFTSLESNFVYGFLRIVDAETSPTCLVEVFELYHDVASIKKFDIFKEDLFEAMACYFPIIYSKQKNDKHLETKVRLSNMLNRAMSATSSFAEYVIQLALEKLESESVGSKLSCYQLLQSALPGYSVKQVEPFTHELWTFIRIDSLRPSTEADELAAQALLTLTKLGDVLSQNPTLCTSFIEKIWKDLEISLKSPELNLINSTISIFLAVSSSHIDLFSFFFERANPILLQNFLFNNVVKEQLLCLDALFKMLLYGKELGTQFDPEMIVRFFNMLIDHSSSDIVDLEIRKSTIRFINQLVCMHRFEEQHVAKLIKYSFHYAEQSGYKPSLLDSFFELIKNMATRNCQHTINLLVDPLIMEIDSIVNPGTAQMQNRFLFQLCSIRSACFEVNIFDHLANFLVSKFSLFSRDTDYFSELCSLNILETLTASFEFHRANGEFVQLFHRKCSSPLLDHFIRVIFKENLSISHQLIERFSTLFSTFLSVIDSEIEQKMTADMIQLMDGKLSPFVIVQPDESVEAWAVGIHPKSLNCTQKCLFLSLLHSYFSSKCNTTTQALLDSFYRIKALSIQLAIDSEQVELTWRILSKIALKLSINDEKIARLFEKTLSEMSSLINSSDSTPMEQKKSALGILIWISQTLFVRHHALYKSYVEYFLQLLNNDILNEQALKLVDILYSNEFQLEPFSKVLSPSSVFSQDLHQLILDRYNQTKKYNFLHLLVSHLRFIPSEVLAGQLDKHLTIIITGLKVSQFGDVNLISLALIESILQSQYSQVQAHIVPIFRSVIKLACHSRQMTIRKKALDCICLIIDTSKEQDLLNLKVEFLASLKHSLADRKRLVRASAVKAFCKLSMLGQPGNRSKL